MDRPIVVTRLQEFCALTNPGRRSQTAFTGPLCAGTRFVKAVTASAMSGMIRTPLGFFLTPRRPAPPAHI
jgi:hypothetical protein